jgi:hypothetical protein
MPAQPAEGRLPVSVLGFIAFWLVVLAIAVVACACAISLWRILDSGE